YRTFIEASPHPILTNPIHDTLDNQPHTVLGTLRRNLGTWHTIHANITTAWHHGLDITWPDTPRDTTTLPTYPFQRQSYWLRTSTTATNNPRHLGQTATNHPLIPSAVHTADGAALIYTGRLDPSTQTWLADHAVHGTIVLPGTAILDLALHAAETHAAGAGIDELTLHSPLTITGPTQIQVTVTGPEIAVHSRTETPGDDEPQPWTRHATATVATTAAVPRPAPAEWPPAGADAIDLDDFYDTLADAGLGYGPAFQGLHTAWRHGTDIYAELSLPDSIRTGDHRIHPALLDAALHTIALTDAAAGGPARLPFTFADVAVHNPAEHALRVRLTASGNHHTVRLYRADGTPAATIGTVSTRPVEAGQVAPESVIRNSLFTLDWTEVTAPPPAPAPVDGVTIVAGSDPGEPDVPAAAHRLAEETLRLLQDALHGDAPIAVVTHGAVPIGDITDLPAAAVWGLTRSAQTEHPDRITLVDTDDTLPVETALATGEPQIAVRDGRLYAPRLAPAAAPTGDGPRLDGPVLITGGTGTLGGLLARHLAGRGATTIVLAGRAGAAAPGAADLVAALRELGAEAVVAACDVTDPVQLDALLAEHSFGLVVHTAGVVDDGLVDSLTPERLHAVLRPKVDGAWALARRLPPQTRLVCYSSASGTLGTAGQANYAAANAFLDALAAHRPDTTSIAWGLWAPVSSMTGHLESADLQRLARSGFEMLTAEHAHRLFDAALRSTGRPVSVALPIVPATLRRQAATGALPALLRGLVRVATRPTGGTLARRLADLSPEEQLELLLTTVRGTTATVLGHTGSDTIDADRPFQELGFDSLTAVELRNRLNATTGLRLPATLIFDHPTPRHVTHYLHHVLTHAEPAAATATAATPATGEPIAIVGMACRYPGGVSTPDGLWQLVVDGGDAITGFPTNRGWNLDRLYHPDPDHPGTAYVREGGFLHDADRFDADFFGISPREALATDPQQRLLLETAWESLEDAGIDPATLRGSSTGVFTGIMYGDYGTRLMPNTPIGFEGYIGTGSAASVASGRLSYTYGLEGPAVSVDTACSSSLVAMHLAAQSLQQGECDLALAGGVTVMATPGVFIEFSRQRGLSPQARCKSFAADADGAIWSEGVGLLVLERLSDAEANGHQVLAVIRGSAVNQDGASNGLTAPNGPSQERVIRQALANAGLTTADVDAVEAHGTGTTLGDPIEAQALANTYGRDRDQPLLLGSIKSNIGHSQAAAGVAGVIKMVQAIRHATLPQTLHVDAPSPHLDWDTSGLRLLIEPTPWPAVDRPRRAAVSSFGISGTNAHLIIEQPPTPAPIDAVDDQPATWRLSAKTPDALRRYAGRLESLDAGPAQIAAALTGRALFAHRAVITGNHADALHALATGAEHPNLTVTPAGGPIAARVAFLFSGQGSQYPGMALGLYNTDPVFTATLNTVCEALDPHLPKPLLQVIDTPELNTTLYTQPALFAIQTALHATLTHHGIKPTHYAGHSIGELTAAYHAGIWNLADAAKIVTARATLMHTMPAGAMLAIQATEAEVLDVLRSHPTVDIATINGPTSIVVAGTKDDLQLIQTHFEQLGRKTRTLNTAHAYHSRHTDAILQQFHDIAATLTYNQPHTPIITAGEPTSPEYWTNHIRQTVRFHDTIAALESLGANTYIEIGPHATLTPLTPADALTIPTQRRDEPHAETLANAIARIHTHTTTAVTWPSTDARPATIPTYPFQHQPFWLHNAPTTDARSLGLTATDHPLVPTAVQAADSATQIHTGRLDPATQPWLADHRVHGTVILPGTAILDLAWHAAAQADATGIDELTLHAPLTITAPTQIQVTVTGAELAVHSRIEPADGEAPEPWTRHATASLSSAAVEPPSADTAWPPPGAVPIDLDDLYDTLAEAGLEYGPAFQVLRAAWRTGETVHAEVELPETAEPAGHAVHPALFDGVLHVLARPGEGSGEVRLPFTWSGATLFAPAGRRLRATITVGGPDEVSLLLTDPDGTPVARVASLLVRPAPVVQRAAGVRDGLFTVSWSELSAPVSTNAPTDVVTIAAAATPETDVAAETHRLTETTLHALQAALRDEAPIAVVTHGAVPIGAITDLPAAAVWGLARTAQSEHPGRITILDTDDTLPLETALATGEPQI
ncbi:type I polyketide synthase, partial [Dactylosporangium sp. NPDC051541]|uniref:type I polyketide synthase n=1 Tax=Dactylosporangium sp. NPDC051541 TaxID=3363977 RepID=UPI00379442DE